MMLLTTCFAEQSYGSPRIRMMTWPPRLRNSWASVLLPEMSVYVNFSKNTGMWSI